MFLFDPSENIRNSLVFWCFQGDQKGTLERKGLNHLGSMFPFNWSNWSYQSIEIIIALTKRAPLQVLSCEFLKFQKPFYRTVPDGFFWKETCSQWAKNVVIISKYLLRDSNKKLSWIMFQCFYYRLLTVSTK